MLFDRADGHVARSAGTETNSRVKVTAGLIGWADIVFCMEKKHLRRLKEKYSDIISEKRVVCLNIPDDFDYMDEDLAAMLESSIGEYLL